jgi:hypothetical protein
MEVFKVLAIMFFVTLFISNSQEQGSPAASIGAYITLYKERKRQRLEREKNRTKRPVSLPKVTRRPQVVCEKFPFHYSSCSNSPYWYN